MPLKQSRGLDGPFIFTSASFAVYARIHAAGNTATYARVESRMGAVTWGLWPTLRFPSPLIEPDVPISGIRLSDWLHREAHGRAVGAGVRDAASRVLHRRLQGRTD